MPPGPARKSRPAGGVDAARSPVSTHLVYHLSRALLASSSAFLPPSLHNDEWCCFHFMSRVPDQTKGVANRVALSIPFPKPRGLPAPQSGLALSWLLTRSPHGSFGLPLLILDTHNQESGNGAVSRLSDEVRPRCTHNTNSSVLLGNEHFGLAVSAQNGGYPSPGARPKGRTCGCSQFSGMENIATSG